MKKEYKVLDTSFLSSYLAYDDSNNLKAQDLIPKLSNSILLIPITVLLEIEIFICKLSNKSHIKLMRHILKLLDCKIINIDETFLRHYQNTADKTKGSLKAIDLTVLTTAITNNAELITFDKKLKSVYDSLVKK